MNTNDALLRKGFENLGKLVKANQDGTIGKQKLLEVIDCRRALLQDGSAEAESFAVGISLLAVEPLCQHRSPEEALQWLEAAVPICEKYEGPDWRQRRASAYALMGDVHVRIAETSTAIRCFERALALGDPNDEDFAVQVKSSLGLALFYVPSRMQEAFQLLDAAAAAAERSGNTRQATLQLTNLASLYNQSGEHRVALEYAERALAIEKDDPAGRLGVLWSRANALHGLRRTKEALLDYAQAVRLANRMEYRRDLGRLRNDFGLAAADDGQFKEAAECFQLALQQARKAQDRSAIVVALTNMALLSEKGIGELRTEKFWQDYLRDAEDCEIPRLQGVAHYNLSIALKADVAAAQRELELAVELASASKDRITERMGLNNLTLMAMERNDKASARRYADQMEALLPHLQDNAKEECEVRRYLGVLHRDHWDARKGYEHLERGAQIARESDTPMLLMILNDLGRTQEKMGKLENAIATYEQTVRLALPAGDFMSVSFALFNSGLCYVGLGERSKAERAVGDAIAAAKTARSPHVGEYERVLQTIRSFWPWLGFSAAAKSEARAARAHYAGR